VQWQETLNHWLDSSFFQTFHSKEFSRKTIFKDHSEFVFGMVLELIVSLQFNLSMDHSKDNFRNNCLIFKPNYFISFLITFFSFFFFLLTFFNNYLSPFLMATFIFITSSPPTWIWKDKLTCVFFLVHEMYINLN
jgi:hypothetical protein